MRAPLSITKALDMAGDGGIEPEDKKGGEAGVLNFGRSHNPSWQLT